MASRSRTAPRWRRSIGSRQSTSTSRTRRCRAPSRTSTSWRRTASASPTAADGDGPCSPTTPPPTPSHPARSRTSRRRATTPSAASPATRSSRDGISCSRNTERGDQGISSPALRGSDCLGCQAGCHGFWSRRMALRMVRSLRATAMRATILGLPAARRRSRKALRTGFVTAGDEGCEEQGAAHALAAAADHALALPLAGLAGVGRKACEAGDLLLVEGAELGQLGDEGSGDDRPDAGDGGEEVLLVAPGGRAAHAGVDLGIDLGELLLEGADEAGDALLDAPHGGAALAVPLGDDHLDDLAPAGDEVGEELRRLVGQGPHIGFHVVAEAGDH